MWKMISENFALKPKKQTEKRIRRTKLHKCQKETNAKKLERTKFPAEVQWRLILETHTKSPNDSLSFSCDFRNSNKLSILEGQEEG